MKDDIYSDGVTSGSRGVGEPAGDNAGDNAANNVGDSAGDYDCAPDCSPDCSSDCTDGGAEGNEEKWYGAGVRFECTGCGECCRDHGEYSYVYLNRQDVVNMARHFRVSVGEFMYQYCQEDDGLVFLKMEGPQCLMLKGDKCMVYEVRPLQCRSWPFWEESLDKKVWDRDVVPFCPGVGRGKIFSPTEIKKIAETLEKNFQPVTAHGPEFL